MWIFAASLSTFPNRTPPSASGGTEDNTMSYEMLLNEQDVSLDILARRPDLRVKSGDLVHTVSEVPSVGAAFEVVIDGKTHTGWRVVVGDEVFVRIGTRTFIVGLPQAQL